MHQSEPSPAAVDDIDLESMTTTVSHIVTLRHLQWIHREAARTGKSKSEVVRIAIDAAMKSAEVAA